MRALITCSTCGSDMPANARLCPACGEPGASVAKLLRRDAQETGVPYEELLRAARTADADEASSRETIRQIGARLTELEQRLTTLAERLPVAESSAPAQSEAIVEIPTAHTAAPPVATSAFQTDVASSVAEAAEPDSPVRSTAEPPAIGAAAPPEGPAAHVPSVASIRPTMTPPAPAPLP